MVTIPHIHNTTEAVIFGLDDVIYPQRDYLLQVYYLFAQFLEFTESHPPESELVGFLKTAYDHHGEDQLFDKAADAFGIPEKYRDNFERLHGYAQLPLTLLLYPEIETLMLELKDAEKSILILAPGEPLIQLNKLKHMKWAGLDRVLKVYFTDELTQRGEDPIPFVLGELKVPGNQVTYIGNDGVSLGYDIRYVPVETILGTTGN